MFTTGFGLVVIILPDAQLMSRVNCVSAAGCDCSQWCVWSVAWDTLMAVLLCWWCCWSTRISWSTKSTHSDPFILSPVYWCLDTSMHASGDRAACWLACLPGQFGLWLIFCLVTHGDKLDCWWLSTVFPLNSYCHLYYCLVAFLLCVCFSCR
jgi:hypothetical protein